MTTTVSGTATQLKPLGSNVIVKPTPREEIEVTNGQKVLFQKYAGTEFKLDDEELLILKASDILAIVD